MYDGDASSELRLPTLGADREPPARSHSVIGNAKADADYAAARRRIAEPPQQSTSERFPTSFAMLLSLARSTDPTTSDPASIMLQGKAAAACLRCVERELWAYTELASRSGTTYLPGDGDGAPQVEGVAARYPESFAAIGRFVGVKHKREPGPQQREAALRAELETVAKVSALKKRARADGIGEERIAEADDADNPRGFLTDLIVTQQQQQGAAPEDPPPSALEVSQARAVEACLRCVEAEVSHRQRQSQDGERIPTSRGFKVASGNHGVAETALPQLPTPHSREGRRESRRQNSDRYVAQQY